MEEIKTPEVTETEVTETEVETEFGSDRWRCLDCNARRRREFYASNQQKERERALRDRVLTHYGGTPPKCACCSEPTYEFLTIDHIDGGGKAERLQLQGGGHHNYRHIIKMGFPENKYRVLCFNCNCGRERNKGICPHELDEKDTA